jgi:hypothetical protein
MALGNLYINKFLSHPDLNFNSTMHECNICQAMINGSSVFLCCLRRMISLLLVPIPLLPSLSMTNLENFYNFLTKPTCPFKTSGSSPVSMALISSRLHTTMQFCASYIHHLRSAHHHQDRYTQCSRK